MTTMSASSPFGGDVAGGLERAAEPLGVVHVHLAPEGADLVGARPAVASTAASDGRMTLRSSVMLIVRQVYVRPTALAPNGAAARDSLTGTARRGAPARRERRIDRLSHDVGAVALAREEAVQRVARAVSSSYDESCPTRLTRELGRRASSSSSSAISASAVSMMSGSMCRRFELLLDRRAAEPLALVLRGDEVVGERGVVEQPNVFEPIELGCRDRLVVDLALVQHLLELPPRHAAPGELIGCDSVRRAVAGPLSSASCAGRRPARHRGRRPWSGTRARCQRSLPPTRRTGRASAPSDGCSRSPSRRAVAVTTTLASVASRRIRHRSEMLIRSARRSRPRSLRGGKLTMRRLSFARRRCRVRRPCGP